MDGPPIDKPPIVKIWEGLVLAVLPALVLLIVLLQMHNASRLLLSVLFALLPFGLFPTMFVADSVRNRISSRLAERRHRRQQQG